MNSTTFGCLSVLRMPTWQRECEREFEQRQSAGSGQRGRQEQRQWQRACRCMCVCVCACVWVCVCVCVSAPLLTPRTAPRLSQPPPGAMPARRARPRRCASVQPSVRHSTPAPPLRSPPHPLALKTHARTSCSRLSRLTLSHVAAECAAPSTRLLRLPPPASVRIFTATSVCCRRVRRVASVCVCVWVGVCRWCGWVLLGLAAARVRDPRNHTCQKKTTPALSQ
jgi:hypothetical protein